MPKPKDARRQIPDPENEPNFYEISSRFPLPDDPDFGKDLKPSERHAQDDSSFSAGHASQSSSIGRQYELSRLMGIAGPDAHIGVVSNALSPAQVSAFCSQPLPLRVAYHPSLSAAASLPLASSLGVHSLAEQSNLGIAAALRAGIVMGSDQSQGGGTSYSQYQFGNLFACQPQRPFGGF